MNKREISKNKRRNAKIYSIYKMFAWDLVFFYAVEFLFYTITKGLSTTEVLIAHGLYIFFKLIMYLPATAISDIFGKRNSIILGNILWTLSLVELIYFPGFISVLVFYLIYALGVTLKSVSESNLLYDSVSTKGGDGLYTQIDSQGASWYYILDGIASLMAGYLFVQNNYLPIYICLTLVTIATIISMFFKDVYHSKKKKTDELKIVLNEYKSDLKVSFKFIRKSRRMKSYILFGAIFYGCIAIFDTYRSNLLTELKVPEEQYSMIFAILTFLGGMSVKLIPTFEKSFKNRVLTFISLVYLISFVIVGFLVTRFEGDLVLPIILVFYAFAKMCTSMWWVLESKYLKHFTEPKMRNKMTLTYEMISCTTASIFSIIGGLILKCLDIKNAMLIVSLAMLAMVVLILDYMRKRFGLKPSQYRKEDIEFVE